MDKKPSAVPRLPDHELILLDAAPPLISEEIAPHDGRRNSYSPECVEGLFSEVRLFGILGSSSWEVLPGVVPRLFPTALALELVLVLLAVGHGGAFEGVGLV